MLVLPLGDFQRLSSPAYERWGGVGVVFLSEPQSFVFFNVGFFLTRAWDSLVPGPSQGEPSITGATTQPAVGQPPGRAVGLRASHSPQKGLSKKSPRDTSAEHIGVTTRCSETRSLFTLDQVTGSHSEAGKQ